MDTGTHTTAPHDLSKATRLKHVTFARTRMRSIVQWIIMTLQTVKSENLQSITICPDHNISATVGEADHQEWNGLNRVLVQFWSTHSIRQCIMYLAGRGEKDMRDCAPSLFPELARRGLVDMVELS